MPTYLPDMERSSSTSAGRARFDRPFTPDESSVFADPATAPLQRRGDEHAGIAPGNTAVASGIVEPSLQLRRSDSSAGPSTTAVASGIVEPSLQLRRSDSGDATVASGIVGRGLQLRRAEDGEVRDTAGPSGIVAATASPSSVQRMDDRRSLSSVDRRPGMAGSYLPARSASDLGPARLGVEEMDGYVTAPDSDGEWDTESDDSVRVMLGSQRRSTDPEIVPAQGATHPARAPQEATGSRGSESEITIAIPDAAPPARAPAPAARLPYTSYLRAQANLMASMANLVSAVGWILVRPVPLLQPIGQSLGSALKNGTYAIDEFYKGNLFKATGQAIYATGSLGNLTGQVAAVTTGNTSLMGIRSAGAALTATGQTVNAVADTKKQAHKRASGWFSAAALNLIGTIGYAIEAARSNWTAFVAMEGMQSFHNIANPISGAAEDAGKSKLKQPWLRDPKVVGQGITHLGYVLNGIAWTMNKLYLTKDKETGSNDSQHHTQLIQALGATGMFLVSTGQLVSAYAELPKRPAPVRTDIELAAPSASNPPRQDPPEPGPPDPGAPSPV